MPVFDRPGAPPAVERDPAEEILGRALLGRRNEVVIATKSVGEPGADGRAFLGSGKVDRHGEVVWEGDRAFLTYSHEHQRYTW